MAGRTEKAGGKTVNVERLLLGVLLLGIGVFGIVWGVTSHFGNMSSGQEIFQTEESYNAFKVELSQHMGDVVKWDVSALTSSPPIIVKYSVETQPDYTFPYGESKSLGLMNIHTLNSYILIHQILLAVVIGLFFGGGILSFMSAFNEEAKP
jgi:hypothetical protein